MLRQSSMKGPIIILIKDTRGAIFGGFYCEELKQENAYVGTGESFLFKWEGNGYSY